MSSFTDYLENRTLDHFFRNTPSTQPSTVYLALFTTNPTDAGGGTEITGVGNYARQAITFGAASGGAISNTSAVSWTCSGTNYGTITGVAIFDALTTGNMFAWDDITAATINIGDILNFAIGDIDVTLT